MTSSGKRHTFAAALSALLLAVPTAALGGAGAGVHSRIGGSGSPAIVFQSGLGDGLDVWKKVAPVIALDARVFSYDRPGYGKSAKADAPRDPCTIARELRATLAASGVAPPYVLVGHSAGGLYHYAFARLFPRDVAGLVLVDATHPRHWEAMQRDAPVPAQILKVMKSTVFSGTMRAEFNDQARCTGTLAAQPFAFPVRMLVKTQYRGIEKGAFEGMEHRLQRDWQQLTGVATVEPVPGSGHYIQRDRPEAVIRAIREIVAEARADGRTPAD